MMVKELAATTFRTWGQLGRTLLQVSAPANISWSAARRMIDASAPLFETQKAHWLELLSQSDNLLKPLQDPLRMDFGTHRWLSGDREEAYSDWLAWIVQNLQPQSVLGLFGIPEQQFGPITSVEREVCVPQGHVGQAGRLDLVIRFGERAILVVEIKIGHADRSDTEKQRGYSQWLKKQKGEKLSILLAKDGDQEKSYEGFELLTWAGLCLALRRIARDLCGKQKLALAAMTLSLVGAIERNLLGFSSEMTKENNCNSFDPAAFRHIQDWVRAEKIRR